MEVINQSFVPSRPLSLNLLGLRAPGVGACPAAAVAAVAVALLGPGAAFVFEAAAAVFLA